jgi:GTP-binding protein
MLRPRARSRPGTPTSMPDAASPVPSAAPIAAADPLVIRALEFIGPMAEAGGWRPASALPEIAFVGRSNVGKSSLLNRLVRRKAFARVSNTPGRTREINFFKVNDAFVLADLPGYGYARISKERKAAWKPLIEGFLRHSPMLRGVVQLLDVRHDPTDDDRHMLDFLAELGVPTLVVFTKVDKLRARERAERLPALLATLGLDEDQVLVFSSRTGEGRDALAEAVVELCAAPSWRAGADA